MSSSEITCVDVDGVGVLVAPASFDVYTAPALRNAHVASVNAGCYRHVVDLSQTTYADPTGLGVLVGAQKRANAHGGWLRLAGPTDAVARCLRITGLNRIFEIVGTVEDAINHQTEGVTTS